MIRFESRVYYIYGTLFTFFFYNQTYGPKVEESARGGMKKKCEDGIGGSKSDATKRSLLDDKEDKQECSLGC